MKYRIILLILILSNICVYAHNNLKDSLKFFCKIDLKGENGINIASAVLNDKNNLFLLPFINFASPYLYKISLDSCKLTEKIIYPDTAKYCFISAKDTTFWTKFTNSPLSCYPCTFSFREISFDNETQSVYASVYSLKKLNDTGYLPIPLLLKIDRLPIEIISLTYDSISILPISEFGISNNLIFSPAELKVNSEHKKILVLFDLISRKPLYYVTHNELSRILGGVKFDRSLPVLYFLNDSLGVCYWYPYSPPLIFNFNKKQYKLFKYKGLFEEFTHSNYVYFKEDTNLMRKFMFRLYSIGNKLLVVGGINKGEKIKDFELKKLILQFYDIDSNELLREKILEIPVELKNVKFFSSFYDKTKNSLFFIFYTKSYEYFVYFLDFK